MKKAHAILLTLFLVVAVRVDAQANNPVRSINSSNTVIPRGIWTEFPLPSVSSSSTGIHNLRPEQELHKHTEHPRDHDQLPSA
jgi:hypothetical protein